MNGETEGGMEGRGEGRTGGGWECIELHTV